MATIAKLDVLLGLEDGQFQRGLENSRAKLDKWGSSLRSMGTKLTAGITAPLAGGSIAMINWASDLEQTMGATEQLWGDNADEIVSWSETANTAMGMTQNEALTSANRFNAMFKQMDTDRGTIKDMSQDFTQLSADLSAMWGGSSIEASDALTAALRGNYESMDKYNINLTEAMVSQEAMNIALADGRDEITEGDKVQARYNLIMEQSADAQGQFARETDTTAGKLAILRARVIDAATRFGKLLLPYVNQAADAFSKLVTWVENLSDEQRKWVIIIAAAAAALGPLLVVIGMLLPGIGALVAVVGFLASPVGLVVLAVGALVYIFRDELMVVLRYVIEFIGNLVDAWRMLGDGMSPVEKILRTIQLALAMIGGDDTPAFIAALARAFGELATAFSTGGWMALLRELGSQILVALQNLAPLALQGIQALAQAVIDAAPGLLSAGWALIQSLWDGAVERWPSFSSWLAGLGAEAVTWIGDQISTLWQKGVDLIIGLGDGAVVQWANLKTWLGTRAASAIEGIGVLTSTLWQKGVDLIVGMGEGVTAQWANLKTWLGTVKTLAFDAIGATIATLKPRGTDIMQGMWDGALDKWEAVSFWFVNLPTMIFNAVSDVTATLLSKGTDVLQGMWDGALDKWDTVSFWFTNLGAMIVGAVGNLGSSLYNAGIAVMNGLWDGLKAGWGSVTSWLSGLNPADWKGPEERDKKMLYSPGIWIMEGLSRGLGEGWADVTRQLSGYVPSITGSIGVRSITPSFNTPTLAGAHTGGTTVIDNSTHTTEYVALTESDFQKLLAKSERGNAAADHLSRNRNARGFERGVR